MQRGNGSFPGNRRQLRGIAWVSRLRWAHLVPEALVFRLTYRWGRRDRVLVSAAVEPSRRSRPRRSRPPLSTAVAAVRVATSIWPFRTTCLVRSMVLAQILRRRGYQAEVVIGVREEGVREDVRFAHAWVEVGDGAGSPGFSELARLVP